MEARRSSSLDPSTTGAPRSHSSRGSQSLRSFTLCSCLLQCREGFPLLSWLFSVHSSCGSETNTQSAPFFEWCYRDSGKLCDRDRTEWATLLAQLDVTQQPVLAAESCPGMQQSSGSCHLFPWLQQLYCCQWALVVCPSRIFLP